MNNGLGITHANNKLILLLNQIDSFDRDRKFKFARQWMRTVIHQMDSIYT